MSGKQKPTKGTDLKHPTTLGVNPMAQVTYRGVKYDTDSRKANAPVKSDMIYRGVKHSKGAEVLPSYLDA